MTTSAAVRSYTTPGGTTEYEDWDEAAGCRSRVEAASLGRLGDLAGLGVDSLGVTLGNSAASYARGGSDPMALYYFHVRTALGLVEDEEGIELPNLRAVLSEALISAREFLADGSQAEELQLEVADRAGAIVLRAPIGRLGSAWPYPVLVSPPSAAGQTH